MVHLVVCESMHYEIIRRFLFAGPAHFEMIPIDFMRGQFVVFCARWKPYQLWDHGDSASWER